MREDVRWGASTVANDRPLTPQEIALARSFFDSKIVYGNVHISDRAIGSTAVTLATPNVLGAHFDYYICWPQAYDQIIGFPERQETWAPPITLARIRLEMIHCA